MKRLAYLDGHKTTAEKVNGKWLVGGDVIKTGSVQIAAQNMFKEWCWHKLRGNRLVFDDFMTKAEIEQNLSIQNA